MRWLVLPAVAVCAIAAFVVASAQSPTPSLSPTTTATATAATPTPSPTATAIATPTTPSGPVYKGRPCGVGHLVLDFLIVQEPPPGPVATCIEPMQSTAPEVLYHLRTVPAGLQFDGIMRDDSRGQGLVYVMYTSTADPNGSPPVQVVLSRTYSDLDPLVLREGVTATEADFLPVPGVFVTATDGSDLQGAYWIGPAGLYSIVIDRNRSSLTVEEVASLLEEFTPPAPAPPQTGSGSAQPDDSALPIALLGALLVVASILATYECSDRRAARIRRN